MRDNALLTHGERGPHSLALDEHRTRWFGHPLG